MFRGRGHACIWCSFVAVFFVLYCRARRLRRRGTRTEAAAKAAEELQNVLSTYLAQLMDIIVESGGDVLRLAGVRAHVPHTAPAHTRSPTCSFRLVGLSCAFCRGPGRRVGCVCRRP